MLLLETCFVCPAHCDLLEAARRNTSLCCKAESMVFGTCACTLSKIGMTLATTLCCLQLTGVVLHRMGVQAGVNHVLCYFCL